MNAQLAPIPPSNSFHASLILGEGVTAHISAPTISGLQAIVAKLEGTAANDEPKGLAAPPAAPKPAAAKAAAPSPTPAPTSAPAAEAGDGARPTYDDVKARVLSLAKVDRAVATGALGKFGVDHANKLPLEQYSAFIAHADELLAKK